MSTAPGDLDEDRFVALVTALVVGSGAVVYYVDTLVIWIAWWLGTVTFVGALLVLMNR